MRLGLILTCFSLFSSNSFCQPLPMDDATGDKGDWKLRKQENGIQVYTRDVDGASLDQLRVISYMNASLSSIVAVIMDANRFSEWIYSCAESKILKQIDTMDQYQYEVIDIPAPFSDRDAVIHFTLWQDKKTKVVYTHSVATPDFIPKKDGLVRLPVFDGVYQLIPLTDGKVEIIYTLQTDPGGYIPDWLVNWTIVTGPYQSTLKMQAQVKKPEYAEKKLSFIEEP